ncbi:hypothetical protein TCAL_10145 [Tigriopus californicus]|uniref:Tyr recombinase domain-containing protein n=1 Tax=Tigriopus californicus TaxID=6832 RepID=A0A553PGY5_TIGCA|nr:hypothetical protein TCAL_10145 [Tigriopus californicus]|eukprot:TCALIF_10145-PA protein Name:"Protein of unknown function" AED:0.41 eAED:0.41 QI:0/-1/0/1/-1/1/1/0/280
MVIDLPANAQTAEYYLADLATTKETVSPVVLASAAIGAVHKFHRFSNPAENQSIQCLLQGVKNLYGKAPIQRQPITKVILRDLLRHWLTPSLQRGDLIDWRSARIESLLFHLSARWGDLSRLLIDHFQSSSKGLTIFFPKRKNDQTGRGHRVILARSSSPFCPIALTEAYFLQLGTSYRGFVVPRIRRIKGVCHVDGSKPATYQSCRSEQVAALSAVGLDPSAFGLHSGRIGSTVILRNAHFDMSAIARRVGWSPNSNTVLHYAQKATAEFEAMNKALEL